MAFTDFNEQIFHEIQQKSLEMLVYFKQLCDENGLLFYLCGGGCIGAVRDGGFVPWDDDIDVFMPRPDYERLQEIWSECVDTARYTLQYSTRENETKNMFATMCDNNTTFIKSFQKELDINHGLQLDILPLDGAPTGFARTRQKLWSLCYSLYIIGEPPTNHGGAVRLLGKAGLVLVPSKRLRYRLWQTAQRHMSRYDFYKCDYSTELCSGPAYIGRNYPASIFKSAVYRDFEGLQMPIPCGYDTYLTMAFGDYMTPPPESERQVHHDFEYIDMHRSYREYKGIYYCVKD